MTAPHATLPAHVITVSAMFSASPMYSCFPCLHYIWASILVFSAGAHMSVTLQIWQWAGAFALH